MTENIIPKQSNFTEEELSAFNDLYYKEIAEKGFLYLSYEKLPKKQKNSRSKEIINNYFKTNNIKTYDSSKPAVSRVIFDALKRRNSNLDVVNYCIFDKSKEIKAVHSLSSFLSTIKEFETSNPKERHISFFRGQSSFNWALQPSLFRSKKLIDNEHIMIAEMIRLFPSFLADSKRIDILTKLQHYGLPTRLLDLTENPLIALFFACAGEEKTEDGRIFYFNPLEKDVKYTNSDTVAILANLSKIDSSFGTNTLKEEMGRFLWFIQEEKPNFTDYLDENAINQCCFVKTHLNNDRIRNQGGAFIIFGAGKTKHYPPIFQDNLEKEDKYISVACGAKETILSELKQLGIHEGTIYPEITKVADFIKKEYGGGKSPLN